jgi:hypothetical protein
MVALLALQTHWEEIGLTGRSPIEKFYDLNAQLKQRSKR